ncbi:MULTISPECIES: VRR-NUC domain-containing protein [unclassified Marinobacter]|uniref:VRR-NUC domain-containing protein n=1 Tax=unclassified Marinobacter TaxID=83889 RepID=UPI001268E41A|nr:MULTISPECIES: VRR-NUC domain-containing protein [unclassified Marinobacter]QFS86599.1 VRR-NUC domain protein [Marinobacter sp. THAF197a]QFT50383.1 VRR-NUC domain protein [Marinobacter sp. THAF39]QFT52905.1 VRR-NUC domain protein [Marinobacter sp. THAF39]
MIDDPMLDLDGEKKDGKVEKRKLLEKDIENAVCKYARDRYKMKAEKFTSPGRRAVPDRLFSVTGPYVGVVFFIEFKAPGKKATEKQERDHQERREMGFNVFVVDDIDQGKKIVDQMAAYAAEL